MSAASMSSLEQRHIEQSLMVFSKVLGSMALTIFLQSHLKLLGHFTVLWLSQCWRKETAETIEKGITTFSGSVPTIRASPLQREYK